MFDISVTVLPLEFFNFILFASTLLLTNRLPLVELVCISETSLLNVAPLVTSNVSFAVRVVKLPEEAPFEPIVVSFIEPPLIVTVLASKLDKSVIPCLTFNAVPEPHISTSVSYTHLTLPTTPYV